MRGAQHLFDLNSLIKRLESDRDSALLRLTIGMAYWQKGEALEALLHLERCVAMAPRYSAAWRLIGKIHHDSQQLPNAIAAYSRALECARQNGENQLVRELQVRIKRTDREISNAQRKQPGSGRAREVESSVRVTSGERDRLVDTEQRPSRKVI